MVPEKRCVDRTDSESLNGLVRNLQVVGWVGMGRNELKRAWLVCESLVGLQEMRTQVSSGPYNWKNERGEHIRSGGADSKTSDNECQSLRTWCKHTNDSWLKNTIVTVHKQLLI
jgi:hypothetical protein